MLLPANLRDIKTGDYLYPAYKYQDAMGVWQEKTLDECSSRELMEFAIKCYNALVYCEATSQKIVDQRNLAEKSNDKLKVENSVMVNRIRNLLASEESLRRAVGKYQFLTVLFMVLTIFLSVILALMFII